MARQQDFSNSVKSQALSRSNGRCENCGVNLSGMKVRYHHDRPVQDGGTSDVSNCVVLCQFCHEGSDFNFRQLHPNAPPRVMFSKELTYSEKVDVAKRQHRRYEQQKRSKSRKSKRDNPFED